MAILGGEVERLPPALIRHGGLRPPRCQVLRNREMAKTGGEVERLDALLNRRGGLRPTRCQVCSTREMPIEPDYVLHSRNRARRNARDEFRGTGCFGR